MAPMSEAPSRRARGRWRAATLVAWLGIPGLVSAAEPGATVSVQSRFEEGKQHFEEKRYLEAAEVFTEVLGRVDEELLNRPTRENVMRNVLIAYEWAYRSSTDDQGSKDVTVLDAGQRVLDEYRAELQRVYPSHPTPSDSLAEAIGRYEEARRIAHEAHGPSQAQAQAEPETEVVGPCLSPPPPEPTAHGKGCGGDGDSSVAWLGMIALPVVRRRRRALERVADRLPPDVVQRLRQRTGEDE